ncbi:MAG: exo-alpha-sialidase, partial [Bryobacterales bacterium]|nr:exo-alpha-sialidase [Bryobacterales bacterium]
MPISNLLHIALSIAAIQGPDGVVFRQPQLARAGDRVLMTMGAGNAVYFASSRDHGATFSKPERVAESGKLMLGRHRGPRIAAANGSIVVSANVDGDLLSWRSGDGGATWSQAVRINSVPKAAREGLHAMASGAGMIAAVWLDLREQGMRLYGAVSKDGGSTWSENRMVYESPDGNVCECCHPSVKIGPRGEIV